MGEGLKKKTGEIRLRLPAQDKHRNSLVAQTFSQFLLLIFTYHIYIYLDLPDLENFPGLRLSPRFVPQNQGFGEKTYKKKRVFQKPFSMQSAWDVFFPMLFTYILYAMYTTRGHGPEGQKGTVSRLRKHAPLLCSWYVSLLAYYWLQGFMAGKDGLRVFWGAL